MCDVSTARTVFTCSSFILMKNMTLVCHEFFYYYYLLFSGALPMYYWVLGQIDESLMVWTYPDGTNVTQSVSMYPSWSYLQNNYASTGVYYNGVPFSDYRLCFSITYQSLIGINPALRSCHVACHDPNVV